MSNPTGRCTAGGVLPVWLQTSALDEARRAAGDVQTAFNQVGG
jgi:hypothetical protein